MSMHKGLIGKSEGGASVHNEQYLHQYIERKTDNRGELGNYAPKPKLTFEEWYSQNPSPRFWTTKEYEDYLRCVWNASRENV